MLKIYPCVILRSSELYGLWKKGDFKPYTDKQLFKILKEIKKNIPPYARIIRVIRDIPAEYIEAGSKLSNLRQDLLEDQKKNKWQCRCIRCREVREEEVNKKDLKLKKVAYKTSGGEEIFLSWEDAKKDKLVSFLRLFIPYDFETGKAIKALEGAVIVRELHTYGRLVSISKKGDQSQHTGLGRSLLRKAEQTARDKGYKKIAVISGVGVRDYYKKMGYKLKDTYMIK